MTITSFYYLFLLLAGVIVYYLVPRKIQWVVLLLLSFVFYWFAGTRYTFSYIAFSTLVIYIVSNLICRGSIALKQKTRKCLLIFGIVLCVLPWLLISADDLWLSPARHLLSPIFGIENIRELPLVPAMGMGYYMCMTISYLVDCYWDVCKPQKNPLKMLLYVCFFPQLTAGPISRYNQQNQLFEGHAFSYENITRGAQRILWGFCKKLVLAERLAVIVNGIWADTVTYSGVWHWIEVLIYPLYLYSDFSGCLDIVLGSAELFGIKLPENFNNPFFSRTVQEFWRRFHITLGQWAKDYFMYPILKSSAFVKLSKILKNKIGKHASKFLVTTFASGVVWLVMGAWHGGMRHIIGVSLYYWILLTLAELIKPYTDKLVSFLNIKTESFAWHFFQSARTYLIYGIGVTFFAAPSVREAFSFIKSLFTMRSFEQRNFWILFDGSIIDIGCTWGDINIILLMILILMIVGGLREKYIYARNWVAAQSFAFRWAIWIILFFIVLIWGQYGEQYNAAEFIYQAF